MVRLEWTDKGNISIHAPTRGATSTFARKIKKFIFQSTLLQEERRMHRLYGYWMDYFNPRSYKRSDIIVYFFGVKLIISIHAPTRGATCADAYL